MYFWTAPVVMSQSTNDLRGSDVTPRRVQLAIRLWRCFIMYASLSRALAVRLRGHLVYVKQTLQSTLCFGTLVQNGLYVGRIRYFWYMTVGRRE